MNRLKTKIQEINDISCEDLIKKVKKTSEYKDATPLVKRSTITKIKKENSKIIYRVNKIILNDFDENEFLNLVKELEDEKFDI